MRTRTILITLGAAVVAFGVAFGIGKASSGGEAAADNAAPAAQTFEVTSAEVTATAPKAGLPGLKPKPKPKPTPTPPPATSTTPPPTNTTPPPQNTTPPPVTGGEQPVTGGEQPVSGGGEG
jgi:outer membrane biosynthesis protein TonB